MGNWTVPPPRLDTEQRNFLEKCLPTGKNYWISGFPGSGKSTLLAHAIRVIKADNPNADILVVVFTRSLIEMFEAAFKEMGLENIEIETMYEFMDYPSHYDFILCDEVQDLTPRIIKELSKYSSCLIAGGDENQSIYMSDPRYKEETVNPQQISSMITGETYPLTIVHRLSPPIQHSIQRLIPTLKLSGLSNMADHQTQIRLCHSVSEDNEVKYIWKEAVKAPKVGKTSAILFPNQQTVVDFVQNILRLENKVEWIPQTNGYKKMDFGDMNDHLNKQNIKIQYVGNGYGNFDITNNVYVMTYYSAKGLDFDNVFLPNIDYRLDITASLILSKKIFMVAMTRSRNNLYVCYATKPHPFVSCISVSKEDYVEVDIEKVLTPTTTGPIGF